MTISSTTRIAGPFVGNGTASTFPFTFKVFAAADLDVVRLNSSTGVESTLVLSSDYSVTLNGDQNSNPGGSITLLAGALASGFTLTITSDIANLQPTDLTNQGGFYPEVITDALDRATIQIQQMSEDVGRSLKAPLSDGTPNMELPTAALRANSFLAFDANGLPTAITAGTSGAPTTITRQTFSGTGSQTVFTLASDPGALGNSAQVYIGGVYQQRSTYTIAGTTLTFSAAPVAGTDNIEFVNFLTSNIGATSADLVTYTPAGSGAVARSAASKLGEMVSVKDFGAVGDGVTDDTANFQAAMTATRVQGGQNPKKLCVPKGTYKITNYLVCGTNQYIEFDQGAVINLVPATNIETTAAFVASNQTNVTLIGNGATINGTRTGAVIEGSAAAFYLYGSDNVRIENFNINDIATDGITITGDVTGSGPCTNVLIENCVVNNCRRNGMSIIHAEGVTVIGGKYKNSNGSPAGPYAGIDVEPNQDQWAKNIQIIGVYTENNPGGSLLFVPGSQGNVRGSIYDVTVIGGRSYKDGALASRPAIRFASGNSTYQVSGQVVIRDFIVDSPYGCGVSWDNWDVDKAPPVYLENVTVINPDWSLNTSTNSDRTGFVIVTTSAQAVTTQGNIFLTNCKSIDTRASARMTWGFVIDCDSGKSVKNITIRDHTTINQVASIKSDGVVSAALITGGAVNVDVVYSTPRTFDIGGSGAIGNYVGQRINVTSSASLTLPFAGDCVGSSYEIQNAAGVNSVTLVVQSGDTIAYPIGVASTDMVIDANALIRLRSMGGTTWRVENIQGAYRRAGMSAKIYAVEYSTAAPASGTWQRGDRVFNSLPAVGNAKSWVCTVGGTPGTWVSEGNL